MARIFVTGTVREESSMTAIKTLLDKPGVVFILMDQPLSQTIALLKRASLFIGNNSGILHIAAALNTPTISTMGPTYPIEWSPYGDKGHNIVLNKKLPCSPCSKGICDHHSCMNDISVDEVMDKVKLFIKPAAQGI